MRKQADLLHDLGEKCQDTQRRLREFLFEQDLCKICYENPCLLALIPCGHVTHDFETETFNYFYVN